MIDPEEIKLQALKWWKPFLQTVVSGESFFPKQIERIGKIKPAAVLATFGSLQEQIAALYSKSKKEVGYGYTIKTVNQNFRRTGAHELPDAIEFETAEDFIRYTGKNKEWKTFLTNKRLIQDNIPSLNTWVFNNVEQLADDTIQWEGILKVCTYFHNNPRPQLYIRQLPVDVHTKFIENNESLLRSLLDFLIPDHVCSPVEKTFARRYYLSYDEVLIRIRILDASLALNDLRDLSIRLSDFHRIDIPCRNILLAENKMNFLTLPSLSNTIAIWSGGGFNVSYLKDVAWLKTENIFYWGDLDIQGFHILHQMRSYFPQTKSVMMDKKTYEAFSHLKGTGKSGAIANLPLLNNSEYELFKHLKEHTIRLEQEKIPQAFAEEYLKELVNIVNDSSEKKD